MTSKRGLITQEGAERHSLFHSIHDRTNISACVEYLCQDTKRGDDRAKLLLLLAFLDISHFWIYIADRLRRTRTVTYQESYEWHTTLSKMKTCAIVSSTMSKQLTKILAV